MAHESSRLTTVREREPRVHMKMMRNHFAESRESDVYGALSVFVGSEVVSTVPTRKPLSGALWAAQRQTAYRFGWVNAIFNPEKVLLGDDPNCLKDDGRTREWL